MRLIKHLLRLRTVPCYGYGHIYINFPVTRTIKSFKKRLDGTVFFADIVKIKQLISLVYSHGKFSFL